jgi:hypothetical protein
MRRSPVLAVVIWFVGWAGAQVQHWSETPKETIWRGRYTNCDMGYAVDLPEGVIAHSDLPPSPNHGFLIQPGDRVTTAEVTFENQPRILDVYDQYDAAQFGSARAYLDWDLQQTPNKKVLQVREIVFQGLRAAEARYRVDAKDASELVIYRKGLIYVLTLRTTAQHYAGDSALFAQIRVSTYCISRRALAPISKLNNLDHSSWGLA